MFEFDVTVPDPERSIAYGPPRVAEPGIGALTMPGLLLEVAARRPDHEALVFSERGSVVRWTYAILQDRAREVARALIASGAQKGSRVGILMTNRPEWLAATFGAWLAGAVAVPLSTFSTEPELGYLLQKTAVSILLFERHVAKKDFLEILQTLEPALASLAVGPLQSIRFPFLREVVVVDDPSPRGAFRHWVDFLGRGERISPSIVDATAASVQPADPAGLFLSSGSTDRPKGIMNSHEGIALQCWRSGRYYALGQDVRCWTANGFIWSGTFVMALGGVMAVGGTMILQRFFDPAEALRLFEVEKVNFPVAWPHQWAQLEALPAWTGADLASLHYVDPDSPAGRHSTVHADWSEPRCAYGNTESFTVVAELPSGTPAELSLNCHGLPLPGNIIKIVDPETGAVQPMGQRGEIATKGPTLMLGYIGVPMHESLDEDGFFRSGDGGYLDAQGRLFWEGRLTDVIKTGGANVSPLEVDHILAEHPGVKIGKTVGVPHDLLGEMVVACVVVHDDHHLDERDVIDFSKSRLASYKVPRRVLFFTEQDISFTGSAKIKSGDLRARARRMLRD